MTNNEKLGLVLDWLQEIIDSPEDWKMYYSDSEVKTLAEYTMGFLNSRGSMTVKKEYRQQGGTIFNIGWICNLKGAITISAMPPKWSDGINDILNERGGINA